MAGYWPSSFFFFVFLVFFFLRFYGLRRVMTGSSVPEPKYWENIYFTVDLKFIFHFLSSSLLPTVRGGNE